MANQESDPDPREPDLAAACIRSGILFAQPRPSMATLPCVHVAATAWLFALLGAPVVGQGVRWQLPPHGVAIYEEHSSLDGTKSDGTRIHPFGSCSEQCQPLLFADELVEGGQRWRETPWSLDSIPIWLATDLTLAQRSGPVRHVWPRIDSYGEVTFDGVADKPDAEGWQRIHGRLTRVPVRERAGASPREIELDRHYLSCALDVKIEIRRRFEPDTTLGDRYAVRGIVSGIEWTIDGTLEIPKPRQTITVSGQRTWKLVAVHAHRQPPTAAHPGFLAEVQLESSAAVADQLALLQKGEGPAAAEEGRGSPTGPALHASILFGLARAGQRAGTPAIDAQLAALLPRRRTQAHSHAYTILAIAGLHAPADDRASCLRGQPPRISLPQPMRDAMKREVQNLLRIRWVVDKKNTGYWSFASDRNDRSMEHSGLAIQALDAALRCGITVPTKVFDEFARNLLTTAVDVEVPRAAVLRFEPGRDLPNVATRHRDTRPATLACGWTDSDLGPFSFHGADSVWAMAALLACARHTRDDALRAQCLATVQRAWSWLGHHYTPRHNPSPMPVHRQWRHSFVQALAWLLDESGVRWLDGHDLYFEWATVLLVETKKGRVPTTVADAPAALSLWRQHADATGTITPGR